MATGAHLIPRRCGAQFPGQGALPVRPPQDGEDADARLVTMRFYTLFALHDGVPRWTTQNVWTKIFAEPSG